MSVVSRTTWAVMVMLRRNNISDEEFLEHWNLGSPDELKALEGLSDPSDETTSTYQETCYAILTKRANAMKRSVKR